MNIIKTIDFEFLGDERGGLISLEQFKNVPFEIRRVYFIFGTTSGAARGFHAHKKLEQVAICVKGSCRFVLDNGKFRESKVLESPNSGLYISRNIWREMYDFSDDCVLLVLASDYYDELDYIRNYDEFKKVIS